jgi:hypothetical protein
MKFQKNIGTIGRAARIVVGIFLLLTISLAFVGPASGWALFGLLVMFPLIAGVLGFCPRHALMGMNTCKVRQEQGRKKDNEFRPQACC